jgi:hypothetical protein
LLSKYVKRQPGREFIYLHKPIVLKKLSAWLKSKCMFFIKNELVYSLKQV